MGKSKSTFIGIGEGELAEADLIVDMLVDCPKDWQALPYPRP